MFTFLSSRVFTASVRFALSIISIATILLLNSVSVEIASAADSIPPSDVENVSVTPGDASVTLSWDVATDDTAVTGYKIYVGTHAVTSPGDGYDLDPITVENVITYTVTGLENDETYYFALTAMDATGNESENYSNEVSATPLDIAGSVDLVAPIVSEVTAVSPTEVHVTFSESVVLPSENPEDAFMIVNEGTGVELTVSDAQIDEEDDAVVVLTTEEQQHGDDYILTVGIDLEDESGNPVESGTSDTGTFVGAAPVITITDTETDTEDGTSDTTTTDDASLTVESVTAVSETSVDVVFSAPVVLPTDDPASAFTIDQEDDDTVTLAVTSALVSADGTTVTLTTDPQSPGTGYVVNISGVTDTNGVAMESAMARFTSDGEAVVVTDTSTDDSTTEDTTPPEDVTDLAASFADGVVTLTWNASVDSAKDLVDQLLYLSSDGVYYNDATSLGEALTSYALSGLQDETEEKTYTFKLTTSDETGNESEGETVEITLPASGPEVAVFLVGAVAVGYWTSRKKKNV